MNDNFGLIDSDQKFKAYSGLARYYAAGNDAWLALHAQIEADLYLAAFMLDSYNMETDEILADISQKMLNLSVLSNNTEEALVSMRSIISDSLPSDVLELWENNLSNNEMFAHLEEVSSEHCEKMAETRMNGLSIEDFVTAKYADAEVQKIKAEEFLASGNEWEAVVAYYASDLAAFEAWLFERSMNLKDVAYTQAEMMWSLAMTSLEKISELPNNVKESTSLVRSRLAWVAGIKEAKSLSQVLAKV